MKKNALCHPVEIWQVFTHLEKWVKVKWLIWYKGHGRDNHVGYEKGHCHKKPLGYRQIMLPLDSIGKVNLVL